MFGPDGYCCSEHQSTEGSLQPGCFFFQDKSIEVELLGHMAASFLSLWDIYLQAAFSRGHLTLGS